MVNRWNYKLPDTWQRKQTTQLLSIKSNVNLQLCTVSSQEIFGTLWCMTDMWDHVFPRSFSMLGQSGKQRQLRGSEWNTISFLLIKSVSLYTQQWHASAATVTTRNQPGFLNSLHFTTKNICQTLNANTNDTTVFNKHYIFAHLLFLEFPVTEEKILLISLEYFHILKIKISTPK